MPKRIRSYDDWLMKQLVDPVIAANYVEAATDDSPEMLLVALRNIAESHRMAKVAEEAGVNRESLYRALSEEGNPRLDTLVSVLTVLGLRISVKPINCESTTHSAAEMVQNTPQQAAPVILGNKREASSPILRYMSIPTNPRLNLAAGHANN